MIKIKEMSTKNWTILVFGLLITTSMIILPNFLGAYQIRFFTDLFMWLGLAVGWNIFNGYTGHIDFGYVVYFGVGAYVTSLLMLKMGLPFLISVPLGALFSVLLASLISLPTLRLKGAYFAIATWAFAEAMKQLVLVLDPITGGSRGLSLPPFLQPAFFYYLMFGCAASSIFINFLVEKAKLGYNLKAIRDSELAAACLGIDVYKNKLAAFLISSFIAGIMGGIFAFWITYVHPFNVFDMLITDQAVVMVLLGGRGTFIGPIIGAAIIIPIYEVLWTKLPGALYLFFLGIIVVLIIIFVPEGITGKGLKMMRKARRKWSKISP